MARNARGRRPLVACPRHARGRAVRRVPRRSRGRPVPHLCAADRQVAALLRPGGGAGAEGAGRADPGPPRREGGGHRGGPGHRPGFRARIPRGDRHPGHQGAALGSGRRGPARRSQVAPDLAGGDRHARYRIALHLVGGPARARAPRAAQAAVPARPARRFTPLYRGHQERLARAALHRRFRRRPHADHGCAGPARSTEHPGHGRPPQLDVEAALARGRDGYRPGGGSHGAPADASCRAVRKSALGHTDPREARVRQERELGPPATAEERARRLLDEVAAELAAVPQPLATYRLQLHKGFRFRDAADLAPYLAELGLSHIYTSPVMKAAPGSMHGYDVQDHQQINPELGTAEDLAAMSAAAHEHGLGYVLDIVPNHMGIGSANTLWLDLLENGPSARAARFFDVEWHPVKEELADKVLLPVLGDRYGAVLERGEIQLDLDEGAFRVRYYDHLFPVSPRSYAQILAYRIEELGKSEAVDELKSILFVLEHMPSRHEQDPARREERWREKEVVKRRVATLFATSEPVRRHLEENVRIFNGTKEKPRSFDLLDKLLAAQAYRLAHWRVSSEEINYRRFFDINSLAAVRMEDPEVFEQAHRLPLRLLAEGKINGLRIDHPDGLAYPRRYFGLLQDAHILQRTRSRAEARGLSWDELEPAVRHELAQSKDLRLDRPLYVVA